MSNITIQNVELPIVEIEERRVVTLAMVDRVHQRPEGTARRNFNHNRERMIEGEDYVKVCADEFRTLHKNIISHKAHEDVTLLTESGYLMLVKSFTDDLAWEVQRKLVNAYFRASQRPKVMPSELTRMDILKLAMESEEARLKAEAERDQAIATKHLIGTRREATAMAAASAAKRQVAKLEHQLGFSKYHATILQVEGRTGHKFDFVPLRRWCKANQVMAETVPDKRYPDGVKAWPAGAWRECYGVDLGSLFA